MLRPDDDVIEEFDSEELTGLDQVPRHSDVCIRGGRVTARVVVQDYDGRRSRCCDSDPEDIPGMDEKCVHSPDGDQLMSADAATGVEDQYHEVFPLGIEVGMRLDVQPPVLGG